ncbi:MAG: 3-deoxy-D-manno-octulosonic acid transferase [Alphaproteobacteria bacterium]
MFWLYRFCLVLAGPFLSLLLACRAQQGKEIAARIDERKGRSFHTRPDGFLIWIHAASVGEAQSALILVERLLAHNNQLNILMTTGTVTSAKMMLEKLSKRAIYQFCPLDRADWVRNFLNHWKPDLVLWMESELWPNMLSEIERRSIPALLVNARLSDKSYRRWACAKKFAAQILRTFKVILAQTEADKARYTALGGHNVIVTDNLKYSAQALPHDETGLRNFISAVSGRPVWLFASSHEGEEALALRVHKKLETEFPGLLTIIAPRHPVRGDAVQKRAQVEGFQSAQRSSNDCSSGAQIYIADTMGELGLFYRLSPLSVIGRSFSDDGGGGHNPIEAAQLHSAVLYGPHVQFQQQIYDEMKHAGAALQVMDEQALTDTLRRLLSVPALLKEQQDRGYAFAAAKEKVIDKVWQAVLPFVEVRL